MWLPLLFRVVASKTYRAIEFWDPSPGAGCQRSVSFMRCCLDICCIIEVQASRLLFCRMFLYIQQLFGCVRGLRGRGHEGCPWLSLFTSLGGVILGTEISRVLNSHTIRPKQRSDLIFIDLKHQQRLLSRLGWASCSGVKLGNGFSRFINCAHKRKLE